MEFIRSLSESAMFPSKTRASNFSYEDIADIIYLELLTLQILTQEPSYRAFVQKYALDALKYGPKFDKFMASANDLNVLLTILKNPKEYALKNSQITPMQTTMNWNGLLQFLKNIARGKDDLAFARRFLLNLDYQLNISDSNYRALRRMATEWGHQKADAKKIIMTRLLQAYRARAYKSTMRSVIEKLSREQRLELHDVRNAETVEEPNIPEQPKKFGFLKTLAVTAAGVIGGYMLGKKVFGEGIEESNSQFHIAEHLTAKLNHSISRNELSQNRFDEILESTAQKYEIPATEILLIFERELGTSLDSWISDRIALTETTSGATGAGNIATSIGGPTSGTIGAGFDPDGDTWPYPKSPKSRKDKKKPSIIKRNM